MHRVLAAGALRCRVTVAYSWGRGLRPWVLAAVLAVIPVAYAIPLIGLGMENLNAVRHLDEGEFIPLQLGR